jgi:hypothetical protein
MYVSQRLLQESDREQDGKYLKARKQEKYGATTTVQDLVQEQQNRH